MQPPIKIFQLFLRNKWQPKYVSYMDMLSLKNLEDRILIQKSIEGNLTAFEVLVKRYQEMILRHTFRILKDGDSSEDATQETFIRVYKNLRKFDQKKEFKPWIYKIASNYCLDMIRANSKLTKLTWQMPDVKNDGGSFLDRFVKKEDIKKLIGSVKKLPKKYKIPLVDFYFMDKSYKAIAVKLDLPVNTVKTRIRRGKRKLEDDLT